MINGINVQYLNGIDIQYLNGAENFINPSSPRGALCNMGSLCKPATTYTTDNLNATDVSALGGLVSYGTVQRVQTLSGLKNIFKKKKTKTVKAVSVSPSSTANSTSTATVAVPVSTSAAIASAINSSSSSVSGLLGSLPSSSSTTYAFANRDALSRLTKQKANIDSLINGMDLDCYTGVNGTEDQEAMRNYLVRTKEVADNSPESIQSYRNPETFSSMIGYILKYWDSASREQAIANMAKEERRLIKTGKIADIDDGAGDNPYDSGFFVALAQAMCPQNEVAIACQNILYKFKNIERAMQAENRITVTNSDSTTSTTISVSGLHGVDEDEQIAYVLYGLNEVSTCALGDVSADDASLDYLIGLHGLASARKSDFFDNEMQANTFLGSLGNVIEVWDNEQERNIALDAGAYYNKGELGALFGKLKNAIKKAASKVKTAVKTAAKTVSKGVTTAAKTVAKGVTTAAKAVAKVSKKVAKKIAKVAKKVAKFVVRYNPITIFVRGILLLAARKNWFKLAKRCYPATLEKEEAMSALDITEEYYENSCTGYKKFLNVWTKIGGVTSKLNAALEKGKDKAYSGTGDESEVTFKFVKAGYEASKDEVDAEVEAEEAELISSGAEEVTDSEDLYYETVSTEEEVVANRVKTNQATSFYEDYEEDVTSTIPIDTELVYDTTFESDDYWLVEYNEVNGYIPKANADIIEVEESESTEGVAGVNSGATYRATKSVTIYDAPLKTANVIGTLTAGSEIQQYSTFRPSTLYVNWVSGNNMCYARVDELERVDNCQGLGFGAEVVACISAAVSALAGIVATVAKAFGNETVADIASGISTAAAVVSAGASAIAASSSSSSDDEESTTASSASDTASKVASVANTITTGLTTASTIANTASNIVSSIKSSSSSSSDDDTDDTVTTSTAVATTDTNSSNTKKWIICGVAGLGLIGLIVALASRKSSPSE